MLNEKNIHRECVGSDESQKVEKSKGRSQSLCSQAKEGSDINMINSNSWWVVKHKRLRVKTHSGVGLHAPFSRIHLFPAMQL